MNKTTFDEIKAEIEKLYPNRFHVQTGVHGCNQGSIQVYEIPTTIETKPFIDLNVTMDTWAGGGVRVNLDDIIQAIQIRIPGGWGFGWNEEEVGKPILWLGDHGLSEAKPTHLNKANEARCIAQVKGVRL